MELAWYLGLLYGHPAEIEAFSDAVSRLRNAHGTAGFSLEENWLSAGENPVRGAIRFRQLLPVIYQVNGATEAMNSKG